MKKKVTWLLVLTMLLSSFLLSACGEAGDFRLVLDADTADLDDAPSVEIVRGGLTQWPMDESVYWEIELPEAGFYEFTFEYALDDAGEKRSAWLVLYDEDDRICGELSCGFWSTDSWKKTDDTFVGITLEPGYYLLALYPDEEETDAERFADIKSLTITGTFQEEEPTQETEAMAAGDWWVRPEGYESEGLSLFDVFKLEEGDETAVYYDRLGQVAGEMTAQWEDDTLTLENDFGTVTWDYDGFSLVDPMSGQTEFVRAEDPDFPELPNRDGTWYLNGDANSEIKYVLSGNSYTRYHKDFAELEEETGTWEYGPNTLMMPDATLTIDPAVELGFTKPTLHPILDGKVLLEEDMFDYNCFIHESAVEDADLVSRALHSAAIAGKQWTCPMEEYDLVMWFSPGYFQIDAYVEGDSNPQRDRVYYGGTWELTADDTVHLVFNNGIVEDVTVEEDGSMAIEALDAMFVRN